MAAPGLELMFSSIKTQINVPHDSIICVLHWQMVAGGFKCVGTGENESANDNTEGSEMLADGWNSTPDLYILRYKHTKTGALYILKIINVDNVLLSHLWKDKDDKVLEMNIKSSDFATDNVSSFQSALTNVDQLSKTFEKEMLSKVNSPGASSQAETSRSAESSRRGDNRQHPYDDPLMVRPGRVPHPHAPSWVDPDDPFSVGRGDLNPMGPGFGGGGMFFDPMRGGGRMGPDPNAGLPRRLPPGAIPPGARFDPFGPPGTRPGPDPDHMRPPGNDDMFM